MQEKQVHEHVVKYYLTLHRSQPSSIQQVIATIQSEFSQTSTDIQKKIEKYFLEHYAQALGKSILFTDDIREVYFDGTEINVNLSTDGRLHKIKSSSNWKFETFEQFLDRFAQRMAEKPIKS